MYVQYNMYTVFSMIHVFYIYLYRHTVVDLHTYMFITCIAACMKLIFSFV